MPDLDRGDALRLVYGRNETSILGPRFCGAKQVFPGSECLPRNQFGYLTPTRWVGSFLTVSQGFCQRKNEPSTRRRWAWSINCVGWTRLPRASKTAHPRPTSDQPAGVEAKPFRDGKLARTCQAPPSRVSVCLPGSRRMAAGPDSLVAVCGRVFFLLAPHLWACHAGAQKTA